MVLWMAETGTPKAPAFCQSTSLWYSGTSSKPLGRTRTNLGSFAAIWTSCLRASISAWCPSPARSWSMKSKPVAVPSSITAGSEKAYPTAFRMPANARFALFAIAFTSKFRPVTQFPVFQHDESHALVLSPACHAESADGHAGFHGVLLVLEKVTPHFVERRVGLFPGRARGNCTIAMRIPWSSSGR